MKTDHFEHVYEDIVTSFEFEWEAGMVHISVSAIGSPGQRVMTTVPVDALVACGVWMEGEDMLDYDVTDREDARARCPHPETVRDSTTGLRACVVCGEGLN
jgi:hypothetical protein